MTGLKRAWWPTVIGATLAVATILTGIQLVVSPNLPAQAASASQFDPGNIISDAVFFDGGAMSADQVQAFLVAQVQSCSSTFACLTTFSQTTPSMPAVAGRCAAYVGAASERAADIIARVGAACGISQKALIVLLQKEQGLVTNASPTSAQFAKATGMGCPDSSPCDPTYAGFFYQVYYAARQFKIYQTSSSFNFHAGQVNAIRYNPNTSCGSGQVYIANDATAGLYDYTPYQPNAAALSNLYGVGDSCSAYGNRNFWRYFSDWFGSPTAGSSLVKAANDITVYLLTHDSSGDKKYGIPNLQMLSDYSVLGQIAIVSQSLLDSYTTASLASYIVRSPEGTIYLQDAGYKLLFTSCAQVADYGGSCNPGGYTQLTDYQINQFITGPNLGPILRTTAGSTYYLHNGTKSEVLDAQSAAAAGLDIGNQVLTEAPVSALPLAAPIVRPGVFARNTTNGDYAYISSAGTEYPTALLTASQMGITGQAVGGLTATSLSLLPWGGVLTGAVTSGSGTVILTAAGSYTWNVPGSLAIAPLTVSPQLTQSYTSAGSIGVGSFIKAAASPTVYYVTATSIRPIATWNAYLALARGTAGTIVSVPNALMQVLPTGPIMLQPASLALTATDPGVYLINGTGQRIPLTSFDPATEAGITGYSFVGQDSLSSYAAAAQPLGYGWTCAGTNYVAAGGSIHQIPASLASAYPIPFQQMDGLTCAGRGTTLATQFIRVPSGAIYLLSGGTRNVISNMQRYAQLGGPSIGYLNVSNGLASLIPLGPPA